MAILPRNQRVILDKSFLQAVDRDSLVHLANRGCRLVLIDALYYEYCSTDDLAQWERSRSKLFYVPDAVEVWGHTSELLGIELAKRKAIDDPKFPDRTAIEQSLLASRSVDRSADWEDQVVEARARREGETVPSLLRVCQELTPLFQPLERAIRGKSIPAVADLCHDFVNHPAYIHLAAGEFRELAIDDHWVAWHHAKATLAFFCDYLRDGDRPGPESAGRAPLQKRWVNKTIDLDYLVALAFAGSLATDEIRGEMSRFSYWMFGNGKSSVSSTDLRTPSKFQPRIAMPIEAMRAACARHGVKELALFGSALRDDFRIDSDIDLLVDFQPDEKVALERLESLEAELSGLLHRPVDLVPKHRLKAAIRRKVFSEAQVVYEG